MTLDAESHTSAEHGRSVRSAVDFRDLRITGAITRRPAFLSVEMWWIWLLRADVRCGRPIHDPAAQRDFVAWWFLFGWNEYPTLCSVYPPAVPVAAEPVPHGSHGCTVPRLLSRLYESRLDLQAHFPASHFAGAARLVTWFRDFGAAELPQARFLLEANLLAGSGHGAEPCPAPARLAGRETWQGSGAFGVNLIGFGRAESGVGEDVRMLARALQAASVPFAVLDVLPITGGRRSDRTLDALLSQDLLYPLSIVCMPAFDTAGLWLGAQHSLLRAPVNIGYWSWELPKFPPEWCDVYDLVNEIWAPSVFVRNAHASALAPRVQLIPAPVEVPPVLTAQRSSHGLRDDCWIAIVPFDPNSFMTRKNPAAAVRAFRRAFPSDDAVCLIIRVNGNPAPTPEWQELLREIGQDRRIRVLDDTWDRAEALSLLAACDALISLHRAEGFGRNIAEAIALGVPVVATEFAGPADFLRASEAVRHEPVALTDNDYPFGAGQNWAEPSIDDAARKLRRLRSTGKGVSPSRIAAFAAKHAPSVVGPLMARRLRDLYKEWLSGRVGP